MHKGVILLVKASDRQEAISNAESFLERYGDGNVWDWYQIGGRWTGSLTGYDPEKDPSNTETCQQCGGTGVRDDEVGVANGFLTRKIETEGHPRLGQIGWCNGCDGKGQALKWPTSWKPVNDDAMPCTDKRVVKTLLEWAGGWREAALADKAKSKEFFAGDDSMQAFLNGREAAIVADEFTFDANVYDTVRESNSLPDDLTAYWAVVVDMHN